MSKIYDYINSELDLYTIAEKVNEELNPEYGTTYVTFDTFDESINVFTVTDGTVVKNDYNIILAVFKNWYDDCDVDLVDEIYFNLQEQFNSYETYEQCVVFEDGFM